MWLKRSTCMQMSRDEKAVAEEKQRSATEAERLKAEVAKVLDQLTQVTNATTRAPLPPTPYKLHNAPLHPSPWTTNPRP